MHVLLTATLKSANGLTEDDVVNTFSFITAADITPANIGVLTIPLTQFYNGPAGVGLDPIAHFLSNDVSRAAGDIEYKAYDITGKLLAVGDPPKPPAHGSPVATDSGTLAAGSGARALPREVACAITLRANTWQVQPVERPDGVDAGGAVDRPRQRRSGRLYIGPLNITGATADASSCRPTLLLQNSLLDACNRLADAVVANNCNWSVWSRADGVLTHITHAQVDDAFDTQRRRGDAPTARLTSQLI